MVHTRGEACLTTRGHGQISCETVSNTADTADTADTAQCKCLESVSVSVSIRNLMSMKDALN